MTVWVLVFYMSTGFGSASTGGPGVIDGFTTKQACQIAYADMQRDPKFSHWLDYGTCIQVKK